MRRVWPLLVFAGQLFSGLRAKRNYLTLPEIVPISAAGTKNIQEEEVPGISVIVPARNEEANLPRLLASLTRQDYSRYEIIVVDDASTDSTATITRHYEQHGVRLVRVDGPPRGWTGKNYACWLGANEATYPLLLFVDADTELVPSALRSTVSFALREDVRALSLFPKQECETLWERLLFPIAYQQYFFSINARIVNGYDGPALANGQYFFIYRNVYQHIGGHAANAGSIIDDAALAVRLKHYGIIPLACRGERIVSVRMYTNLSQIVRGFGKNIFPYLQQSPVLGVQTAISTTLAASTAMLFVDAYREKSQSLFSIAILAYIAQVFNAIPWLRYFGINKWHALLTPFSTLVFLAIAINSLIHTVTGRSIAWKGRSYSTLTQCSRISYSESFAVDPTSTPKSSYVVAER
ncbi:MAG: hydroxychlorobactene glucosyltransferase CruC [Ktedonobacteraceae bacterium]